MPRGIPNKRYTPEFKKLVVETMQTEQQSYRETARQFEINDHKCAAAGERIYPAEGLEGFTIERRGRSKGHPPKPLPKEVETDFSAEVQRLRAENESLKNLQALIEMYLTGVSEGMKEDKETIDRVRPDRALSKVA